LFTIFFYTLVWIAVHCALQEYIFDKVQRRLHLSKTRQVKFNESGHTAVFSIYSICHAISILNEMEIHKDLVTFNFKFLKILIILDTNLDWLSRTSSAFFPLYQTLLHLSGF